MFNADLHKNTFNKTEMKKNLFGLHFYLKI